jgi:hypothetical protein
VKIPAEYFFKTREPLVRKRRQREAEAKAAKKLAEVDV